MSENCFYCTLLATTERTRSNGLSPVALCRRCSDVWDQAVATTNAPDDQVKTLFEACRYIVYNTMPAIMSDDKEKMRLVRELSAIIN